MVFSSLKTAVPYHLLVYSLAFGATVYQSFYAGIIAYRALPLEGFTALQTKIFPGYFSLQAASSAFLLLTPPFPPTFAGQFLLGTTLGGSLLNVSVISRWMDSIRKQREAQMELEGKHYKDPTASEDMKKLNKKFGASHGISVLVNMAVFLSYAGYGLVFSSKIAKLIPK